jgi:hypothetical protein
MMMLAERARIFNAIGLSREYKNGLHFEPLMAKTLRNAMHSMLIIVLIPNSANWIRPSPLTIKEIGYQL